MANVGETPSRKVTNIAEKADNVQSVIQPSQFLTSTKSEVTKNIGNSQNADLRRDRMANKTVDTDRPDAPLEAVRYDTIKALSYPRRAALPDDILRSGLSNFYKILRNIRDEWKAARLTLGDLKNRKGDPSIIRERVETQRQLMEAALDAAVTQGHIKFLERYVFTVPCYLPI
jgi:hypothetical protein